MTSPPNHMPYPITDILRNGGPCGETGDICKDRSANGGCICAIAADRITALEDALREAKQRLVETYMPAAAGQGQTDWDEEVEALMPKIDRALTPEGE